MKHKRIYFSKEEYYSEGNHGASSASRDLVYEVYEAVAPTLFAYLTVEEKQLISDILSERETHITKSQILHAAREAKDITNLRERLDAVKEVVVFQAPAGEIINLSDYIQTAYPWGRRMAEELIVPIDREILLYHREQARRKNTRRFNEILDYSIRYVEEKIERKFFPWYMEMSTGRRPGDRKKTLAT